MCNQQLTEMLTDAINKNSLKEIIEILIDIAEIAQTNHPDLEWDGDLDLLESIVGELKN